MKKDIWIIANKGTPVPVEGRPRLRISEETPTRIKSSAYYRKMIRTGAARLASPPKREKPAATSTPASKDS